MEVTMLIDLNLSDEYAQALAMQAIIENVSKRALVTKLVIDYLETVMENQSNAMYNKIEHNKSTIKNNKDKKAEDFKKWQAEQLAELEALNQNDDKGRESERIKWLKDNPGHKLPWFLTPMSNQYCETYKEFIEKT